MTKTKNKIRIKLLALISVLGIVGLTTIFASRFHANKYVLNGVYFADLHLGGLTYSEATLKIDDKYNQILSEDIQVNFEGEKYTFSVEELGASFDPYKTVKQAKDISYGNSLSAHVDSRLSSFNEVRKLEPIISINSTEFRNKLENKIPEIKEPENAQVAILEEKNIKVIPSKLGATGDYKKSEEELIEGLEKLDLEEINLEKRVIEPDYSTEDAEKDAEIITTNLSKRINLKYEGSLIEPYSKEIAVQKEWFSVKDSKVIYHPQIIKEFLLTNIAPEVEIQESNVYIKSLPTDEDSHAQVEGFKKDGLRLDLNSLNSKVIKAIQNNSNEITFDLELREGQIINQTGAELGEMVLLSEGRSNFQGSPAGRSFNIKKGLEEKVNNLLLAPGEEFSFNDNLGPVTYAEGWQASLAIFNSEDLKPVAGGGLCQVSTTLYRALLNAGLNITEKSNHSMFIHYYREYGNGLDAAIYPGSKDLRFINDTDNYILIQAWVEGADAYVEIYGTPDGREVELVGPIYSWEVPEEYKGKIQPRWNQIIWVQKLKKPNGEVEETQLVSSYVTAPW